MRWTRPRQGVSAVLVLLLTAGVVFAAWYAALYAEHAAYTWLTRHMALRYGVFSLFLGIGVLAPPFAVGLLVRPRWMALVPLPGYLLAIFLVLVLSYPSLRESNELWLFIRGLVLPYWVPVGWGGMTVAYVAGRGVRRLAARSTRQ